MRQWLIVAGVAVCLFSTTVVGTLAVQGRLDYAGTRGIPLLEHFFAEPAAAGDELIIESLPPAPMPPAAPIVETAAPAPVRPIVDLGDIRALGPAELDRILGAARSREQRSREREAAVTQAERELLSRQRDLEDREEAIVQRMLDVERERERLEARLAEFEQDVLLIRRDDVRALREYAETLVALDPARAASLVTREWDEESGRKRVTKALALVDPTDVGAILEHLPDERLRDVMLERLKVVRQPGTR